MGDKSKTKTQLIAELADLRRQLDSRRIGESSMNEDRFSRILNHYRSVLQRIPSPAYLAQLDGRMTPVYLNPRLTASLDCELGDTENNTGFWSEHLHPDDRETILEEMAASIKNAAFHSLVYRLVSHHGRVLWFRDDRTIIHDKNGAPVFISGILFDITEFKALEDERDGRLTFLQTIVDAIPVPVFFKDAEGRYTGCNNEFEAFLGRPRSDFIGRTVHETAPADLAKIYHEKDQALLSNPGIQVYEASVAKTDGKRRRVIFHKAAFMGSQGKPAGLVGAILDVTELRQAQHALEKAQQALEDRVKQRTAQLAQANEELKSEIEQRLLAEEALKKSNDQFKTFAYSVVHDLKSPTIGIYGLTRKLHENYFHQLGDRGKNYCQQILKASEHVALLVERINIFISSKESMLKKEAVDLNEILSMIRDEFSVPIQSRGIQWIQPAEPLTITGDRVSFQRIFRNLVDNALKYGGEKLSRLVFEYREEEMEYHLIMTDDGVGIPSKDSERLFGLFQRHDSARNVLGAGLGLAIVREIVSRHGGMVWAESGEESGAAFHITIAKSF